MQDLYETLNALLQVLDRRDTTDVLIGGIAVRAHAIPRNTVDLDLMISVESENLPALLTALEQEGFEIPEAYQHGWVDRVQGAPLIKTRFYVAGGGIDADLFLVESSFQKSVMQRRLSVEVAGFKYWIATAEDLVLLKLLANRPRDRLDVADLFFISGQLDLTYLRRWADQLKIRADLEAAIKESEEE